MGKYLLFIVAAVALATATIQRNSSLDPMRDSRTRSAEHLGMVVAEQLSATGLSEASGELAELTSMPGVTELRGEMMGGSYTVTITPASSDVVTVRSVGRLEGAGRNGATHVREAAFQLVSSGGSSEPPVAPFLRSALTIERSLTMNSAQRVLSGDPAVNANVHTNGGEYININDHAGIQGFYHSVTSVPHDWLKPKLRRSFVPNSNPDGLEVFQTVDRIEIPVIRAADYLPVATQVSHTNVQNVQGVLDFASGGSGTEENPAVWVIKGDFNTSGTLEIRGHGNIITQGNINLQGHTTTGPNSAVSFYSERDISVNGTTQIVGSLMANQNIQLGGYGTQIHGPISTRGHLNFNSNAHILYRPLSGYMTKPMFPDAGGSDTPSGGGGAPHFVPISYRTS